MAHCDLRQTAGVEPGKLIQRPDITANKRQRVSVQAQRIAIQTARDLPSVKPVNA